jgi:hypothetical protein
MNRHVPLGSAARPGVPARVRARTGVSVARQLRRALVEYLDQHEAAMPPARRAAAITTTRRGNDG